MKGEWHGATSAKFTTERRHISPPQPVDQAHPLYSLGGKKHFDATAGYQPDWKPSVVQFPDKYAERQDRKQGVKYIPAKQGDENKKDRPERRHAEPASGPPKSWEDDLKGKQCFVGLDNRKSVNEYPVE